MSHWERATRRCCDRAALVPRSGCPNLYFKLETGNPAGSYKDRFAAAAISEMRAAGKKRCIATSSGNAGAALAAYASAADIKCRIAVVEAAPESKLRQIMAYGAQVLRIRGFGLDPDVSTGVMRHLERMGGRADSSLQISAYTFSPVGMSGVQSIAYELAEQQAALDHVFAPAGSGGLCIALARGFAQLVQRGGLTRSPAVELVQPAGNDTIATPLATGAKQARDVNGTSRISGLQVPNVIDGHLALTECRATQGTGHVVPEDLVWETQRRLARDEGLFVEPAGAVALAGVLQAARNNTLQTNARIACIVTGAGFKDEDSITRMLGDSTTPVIDFTELERME